MNVGDHEVTVKVTDNYGSIALRTVNLAVEPGITGITLSGKNTALTVYPSPSQGVVSIYLPQPARLLQIFNMRGELQTSFEDLPQGTIEAGGYLAPGVYSVLVSYKDGSIGSVRMVKVK